MILTETFLYFSSSVSPLKGNFPNRTTTLDSTGLVICSAYFNVQYELPPIYVYFSICFVLIVHEYLVIPYGFMNAPSVFQSFVDEIFRDLHGQGVVVYIDEILLYSATRAEHVSLVHRVLGRLLEHDLYVKAEKCLFFQQSISFLGYRISTSGVEMEIDRISANA